MLKTQFDMGLDPPTPEEIEEHEAKNVRGKALIAFFHGEGYVLTWEAGNFCTEVMRDFGAEGVNDGFPFASFNGNVHDGDLWSDALEMRVSGLFYAEIRLEDDGPGDYPGTRECCPAIHNVRLATAEEWGAFARGDTPWEKI